MTNPLGGLPPALRLSGLGDALRSGASVRGVVVASSGGSSTLDIGGTRVQVPGSFPLDTHVAVRLGPGGEALRVVPPSTGDAPAAQTSSLAQALRAAGLPATPSLMEGLGNLLGTPKPEQLGALVFALIHRLPISRTRLSALANLLRAQPQLGQSLLALQAVLQENPAAAQSPLAGVVDAYLRDLQRLGRRLAEGDKGALARLLLGGGGLFETRLAAGEVSDDLKRALLAARAQWGESETLASAIDDTLESIDRRRLLSQRAADGTQRWYAELPWFDGGNGSRMELLVRHRPARQHGDDDGEAAFTVVATLSELGALRAEVRWDKPHVDVMVRTESDVTVQRLREAEAELRGALDGAGCVLRGYRVVRVESVEPLAVEEILPEVALPSGASLDVTI